MTGVSFRRWPASARSLLRRHQEPGLRNGPRFLILAAGGAESAGPRRAVHEGAEGYAAPGATDGEGRRASKKRGRSPGWVHLSFRRSGTTATSMIRLVSQM